MENPTEYEGKLGYKMKDFQHFPLKSWSLNNLAEKEKLLPQQYGWELWECEEGELGKKTEEILSLLRDSIQIEIPEDIHVCFRYYSRPHYKALVALIIRVTGPNQGRVLYQIRIRENLDLNETAYLITKPLYDEKTHLIQKYTKQLVEWKPNKFIKSASRYFRKNPF